MSIKCRVWWPKEISSSKFSKSSSLSSSNSLLLFGWFISCSPSCLDVVVAFAYSDDFLSRHCSDSAIQDAVHHANEGMPVALQKSRLAVVGRCVLPVENTDDMHNFNMVQQNPNLHSSYAESNLLKVQHFSLANSSNSSCRCFDYDGLLEQYSHASRCSASWIQLVHDACSYSSVEIGWIPALDHLHWNDKLLPMAELHVMIYETPRYGGHYFAINVCSSMLIKCSTRRPRWVDELYHKPQLIDMDTVILALNCSTAANAYFCKHLGLQSSSQQSVLFLNFFGRLLATFVATFSTFLYIVLQLFNKLVGYGSNVWICTALKKIFSNTWKNIQVRCHQFLYWPIVLDEIGLRSQASVDYAEKAGLQRHSFWSSVAIDVILGNFVGFALLIHVEDILEWCSTFAIHFTDDVLRTGCVWLMGVPAGFKLNTELAGVLGIISLNAIQIWSTLWFSAAIIFSYFIKAVAWSGILLGMTISVALISDIIAIFAFHVNTLEYLFSLLYSLQIQALTALWRLFRGRKWNPLRQRLDSYEYNVEQHVVGSLLFTPLLLLLPTTSVFYIFFAIMNLTILFFLTLIEITIFVIHDTPYSKIILWLVKSKRFPSGIWFETFHSLSSSSANGFLNGSNSSCKSTPQDKNTKVRKSVPLLSVLHSNIFTFGEEIGESFKGFFCNDSSVVVVSKGAYVEQHQSSHTPSHQREHTARTEPSHQKGEEGEWTTVRKKRWNNNQTIAPAAEPPPNTLLQQASDGDSGDRGGQKTYQVPVP